MPVDVRAVGAQPTSPQAVAGVSPEDTARFKEWLIAKEIVNRRNRNLLQYAAGLATLLGIGGATTGIFALADSLGGQTQPSLGRIGYGALVVGFVLAGVLALLVIKSIAGRRQAEREADERLRTLPNELLVQNGVWSAAETR